MLRAYILWACHVRPKARTMDAQWGNCLHCMPANQITIPIFRYGQGIFCLSHLPKISDFCWFMPTLTILLASLLNWYTHSASPHCAASDMQSWLEPPGGTNKCTASEGLLRTYCSIPYTGFMPSLDVRSLWPKGWT